MPRAAQRWVRTMIVKLLECTPNPDRICAASARGCYSKKPAYKYYEEGTKSTLDDKGVAKVLNYCIESGHHDVIEHASFTFSVEGVTRALTHQLVRHRIASYSQQSQRYVELKLQKNWYTLPKTLEGTKPETKKKLNDLFEHIAKTYDELLADGVPAEDARFLLPNATKTNIVVTMNCRELLHFFSMRCCFRAQWEIRILANKMLKICKEKAPIVFSKAGAACFQRGYCPEVEQCRELSGVFPQLGKLIRPKDEVM